MILHNIFQMTLAKSEEDISICYKIREIVFILEQKVPVELELDEDDKIATHFLLFEDNTAIGTARILTNNKTVTVGRFCILKEYRKNGAGLFFMKNLIDYCKKENFNEIILGAQEQAKGFYAKLGFTICSEMYMDANIPHFKMKIKI